LFITSIFAGLETIFSDIVKACAKGSADLTDESNSKPATSEVPARSKPQPSDEANTPPPESCESNQENTSTSIHVADPTTMASTKSGAPLFILYGSETGNSEQIAKDLAASYDSILGNPDAQTFFPSVVCVELDQFKKKCLPVWEQEAALGTKYGVLIVASTTGNGESPENSNRFMRFVKRKQTAESQPFRHVNFAVLGLGDTNYDQFCNTGKIIDKKLLELGGTRVKALACADEATGLEDTVDPWVNSILGEITVACRGAGSAKKLPTQTPSLDQTEEEKKMEVVDTPTGSKSTSRGVKIVRSLLSLRAAEPMISVEHSMLPSLGASRSSCELFKEGEDPVTQPESAIDDRATISTSSSDAAHYSIHRPFESSIIASRYLSATSVEAASAIAEKFGPDGIQSDKDVILAREIFDSRFPLTEVAEAEAERNGKRVMEMTLSLPDDYTLEYQPGDALGLVVSNTTESIEFVLEFLRSRHAICPEQKVSIDSNAPINVEEAIRDRIDLCSTIKNKRLVHSLAQFASDPEEIATLRFLSSKKAGSDAAFNSYIVEQRRSVVDLLRDFPSCQHISLEGLLGLLPSIPPRYYSVSSSPLEHRPAGLSLTVTFSVVDYVTASLLVDGNEVGLRRIHGVATGYLEAICAPFLCNQELSRKPSLKIFPKPTTDFRLPATLGNDLVLIGPGTGISPFMGFLAHRRALASSKETTEAANAVVEGTWRGGYELEAEDLTLGKEDANGLSVGAEFRHSQRIGEVDVYFGCRHADHDWLYAEEMKSLKSEGVISNMYTAFSRDGGSQRYVQDIMKSNPTCSERLARVILETDGSVYICGDGNHMAREVQNTIAEILGDRVEGGIEKGRAIIEEMKANGRFLLDIWS
jgi:sulfite reductase alpha subunit-like flavoprotein